MGLHGPYSVPDDDQQWRQRQQHQLQQVRGIGFDGPDGRRQNVGASVPSNARISGADSSSGQDRLLSPPLISRDGASLGVGAFGPASAPSGVPFHVGGPYPTTARRETTITRPGSSPQRFLPPPTVSSIPLQAARDRHQDRHWQRAESQEELHGFQSFRPVLSPPLPVQDYPQDIYGAAQSRPLPPPLEHHPMGSISSYEPSYSPGRSLSSYSTAQQFSLSQHSPSRNRPQSVASNASAQTISSQDSGSSSSRPQKVGSKGSKRGVGAVSWLRLCL